MDTPTQLSPMVNILGFNTTCHMVSNRVDMKKPSAFELFCRYHLGLTTTWSYKFANLSNMAGEYGVPDKEVQVWLDSYGFSPEICGEVDYNLPRAHSEAQILTMLNGLEEVKSFAHQAFEDFKEAFKKRKPGKFIDQVNWDDVWGDGVNSEI
jgi:hypothetical protein